jgi:hypothetical protein
VDQTFAIFIGLLYAQCLALGIWSLSLAFALNFGLFVPVRAVPTRLERLFAKAPAMLLLISGTQMPRARARAPAMVRLHTRTAAHARTVERAEDAAFAIPALSGLILVLIGIALSLVPTSQPDASVARRLVAVFLLLFDLAAVLTTMGLRQRAWAIRAPFEWRLYRQLTLSRSRVDRAVALRQPDAVVEELALAGARQVEIVLRLRFPATCSSESERVAAELWDRQIALPIVARSSRILDADATKPNAWFHTWMESVAAITLMPPANSAQVSGEVRPMVVERPSYRSVLTPGFTLMAVAAIGFFITVYSPSLQTDISWRDYLGIPAALVAVIACGTFISNLGKRRAAGF